MAEKKGPLTNKSRREAARWEYLLIEEADVIAGVNRRAREGWELVQLLAHYFAPQPTKPTLTARIIADGKREFYYAALLRRDVTIEED